jgi:hypothetical protein
MKDDENVLRGPEIRIAACDNVREKTLHAIAYYDIFDKKKSQKKKHFFATGFPSMDSTLCRWAAVAKSTTKPIFSPLFGPSNVKDDKYLEIKQLAEDMVSNVTVLTKSQHTVEWFTLCTFHLSATKSGLLFISNYDNKTDGELLNELSKSWFSRNHSTLAMVSAVLQAFSKLNYVASIFEVGLLENKTYPWIAASPDGVAVVGFQEDENVVASIEIKTRVSLEQIQQAEEIAAKYHHKLIVCDIRDETWKECIEEVHSTQMLLQLWVLRLQLAFYIFATPGSSNSNRKITYIVMGNLILDDANAFFDQYLDHIGRLLIPFYRMSTIAELQEALPHEMEKNTMAVITTRWPFFTATQRHAIEEMESGFPPCNIFKISFQVL